jgi:tRNA pseudouridine13 synthase
MKRNRKEKWMKYRIKQKNEDFRVCEVINLDIADSPTNYRLFCLVKSGISTFNAIDIISQEFNLDEGQIGIAGLKDEEGITQQYLTIESHKVPSKYNDKDSNFWLNLYQIGFSNNKITVGSNLGNAFKIVLRGLDEKAQNALTSINETQIRIPNYYDSQRFGLPNQPALTHLIGKHYLEGNFDKCLEFARESGVLANREVSVENLDSLIPMRERAFWLCSHGSHMWNKKLSELIQAEGSASASIRIADNSYFAPNQDDFAAHKLPNKLAIDKWRAIDGEIKKLSATRDCFIYGHFKSKPIDSESCELQFTLPTGSYATMAIKGILGV